MAATVNFYIKTRMTSGDCKPPPPLKKKTKHLPMSLTMVFFLTSFLSNL